MANDIDIKQIVSQEAIGGLQKTNEELRESNELLKSQIKLLDKLNGEYAETKTNIQLKDKLNKQERANLKIRENQKKITTTNTALEKERIKIQQQAKRVFAQTLALEEKGTKTLIKGQERLRYARKQAREEAKKSLGISRKSGGIFGGLTKNILAAGGAMIGFSTILSKTITTIKDAILINREFEKTITNVLTLLSDADKEQYGDYIKQGAIDIVAEYGLEIKDVNKALFDAVSAGVSVGDAIEFLRSNAELAIGGVTNLSTAVDGVTSIMNAYGLEASKTDEVTSAFFTAQKFGKTTVEELASSIGKTAPIAKQAGVGYRELLSVFAELTKQGVSTDETATAIKATLTALLKPGAEAEAVFKKLGIATGATAIRNNGFAETLAQVSAAAEGNADVLSELIPNVRALTGVGALGTEQLSEMDDILQELNNDYGEGSSLASAYNLQMETGERQSARLKGEYQKLLITLGGGESVFKKIGSAVTSRLTGAIQGATTSIQILSNGSWLDRIKLLLNGLLNSFLVTFAPVVKVIERITGKKIGFEIEANIKKAEDLIKKTPKVVKKAEDETTRIISDAEKKRQEIRRKAAEMNAENAKSAAKSNVANIKKAEEERQRLRKEEIANIARENNEIAKEIEDSQSEANESAAMANDEYLENEKELTSLLSEEERKRTEAIKREEDIRRQLRQMAYSQAIDLVNNLFALEQAKGEARIQSIEQNYDKQISAAEGNDSRQEELEKEKSQRIYEVELELAKSRKKQAKFNLAISTAQGIAQAYALMIGTTGALGIPIAATLTALLVANAGVQLAAINAQPLPSPPQYALGTDYSADTFIAGEKGVELAIPKEGSPFLTPNHATLYTNMKGTEIIPHGQTNDILTAVNMANSGAIDISQLSSKLDHVIKAIEQNAPTINLDKKGVWNVGDKIHRYSERRNRKLNIN